MLLQTVTALTGGPHGVAAHTGLGGALGRDNLDVQHGVESLARRLAGIRALFAGIARQARPGSQLHHLLNLVPFAGHVRYLCRVGSAMPAVTALVLVAGGLVVARREATVSSKVTGKIADVLIDEGKVVAQGQILARLEDASLQPELELARTQPASC